MGLSVGQSGWCRWCAQPLAAALGAADEKMPRALLALLLLLLQPGRAAAEAGLKLTIYDNTGRAVSAATTAADRAAA